MKLAFVIAKYFDFGGQQRDMLRIAKECKSRGHSVHIFTWEWLGQKEDGLEVTILSYPPMTNHARNNKLAKIVKKLRTQDYDCIVGFLKIPGVDIYFTADLCYFQTFAENKTLWHRIIPRYRHLLKQEDAIFSSQSPTEFLTLSNVEKDKYIKAYATQAERFHLIPPGIDEQRFVKPKYEKLTALRNELKIPQHAFILLQVGSAFKGKGIDRSILALQALPDEIREKTYLIILGENKKELFVKLAKKHNIKNQVIFAGSRSDVASFYYLADLLIHPARIECAGNVLIEALVCGLPVLVTENCGYAMHVERANGGLICPVPFQQTTLNRLLFTMLTSDKMPQWHENALDYSQREDLYHLAPYSVDVIETWAIQHAFPRYPADIISRPKLKFAFVINKFFPYGGVQLAMLSFAKALVYQGHEVDIYTWQWEGKTPKGIHIHFIKHEPFTNHRKNARLEKFVHNYVKHASYDCIVGFTKISGVDLYYAGDACYAERFRQEKPWWFRLLPRYRHFLQQEARTLSDQSIDLLLLSQRDYENYRYSYSAYANRFTLLPAGINHSVNQPTTREKLARLKDEFQIPSHTKVILQVSSAFKTKGLGRSIQALASLPSEIAKNCRLIIIGQDKPYKYIRLAKKLKVRDQVIFTGGRHDVVDFYHLADLLIHPALVENTGTIIMEAMACGLPVLTTANCGFAQHIKTANAGIVCPMPFQQMDLNSSLDMMLSNLKLNEMGENGQAYSATQDLEQFIPSALDVMIKRALANQRQSSC